MMDMFLPLSPPPHPTASWELLDPGILNLAWWELGGQGQGRRGASAAGCSPVGPSPTCGEKSDSCLTSRKKTRADKAGGTTGTIPQQWGLLPVAVPSALLPVGRGVCKRHRESQGGCQEPSVPTCTQFSPRAKRMFYWLSDPSTVSPGPAVVAFPFLKTFQTSFPWVHV